MNLFYLLSNDNNLEKLLFQIKAVQVFGHQIALIPEINSLEVNWLIIGPIKDLDYYLFMVSSKLGLILLSNSPIYKAFDWEL